MPRSNQPSRIHRVTVHLGAEVTDKTKDGTGRGGILVKAFTGRATSADKLSYTFRQGSDTLLVDAVFVTNHGLIEA